jgi:hypothetical protein
VSGTAKGRTTPWCRQHVRRTVVGLRSGAERPDAEGVVRGNGRRSPYGLRPGSERPRPRPAAGCRGRHGERNDRSERDLRSRPADPKEPSPDRCWWSWAGRGAPRPPNTPSVGSLRKPTVSPCRDRQPAGRQRGVTGDPRQERKAAWSGEHQQAGDMTRCSEPALRRRIGDDDEARCDNQRGTELGAPAWRPRRSPPHAPHVPSPQRSRRSGSVPGTGARAARKGGACARGPQRPHRRPKGRVHGAGHP